jgi:hypothetical protein
VLELHFLESESASVLPAQPALALVYRNAWMAWVAAPVCRGPQSGQILPVVVAIIEFEVNDTSWGSRHVISVSEKAGRTEDRKDVKAGKTDRALSDTT